MVPSSGFILLPRPVDLLVEGHGEGHSQELRRQNRKWRGGQLAARWPGGSFELPNVSPLLPVGQQKAPSSLVRTSTASLVPWCFSLHSTLTTQARFPVHDVFFSVAVIKYG